VDEFFDRLHLPAPHPPGTRIRLLEMPDDPCPVEPGTEGTVEAGNGGQMHVRWDNGRTLMVLPGVDRYEVIGEAVNAADSLT
jgi:hypothetical protein